MNTIMRPANSCVDIGLTPDGKIIPEPCGRNTAPAILLALLTILKENRDALLFIFPADHVIRDVPQFHERLTQAADLAHQGLYRYLRYSARIS